MNFTVYSIVHVDSGREYVGLTKHPAQRWYQHTRRQSHLGSAIRKYGRDAFTFTPICGLPTLRLAQTAERVLIARRKPAFNQSAGGEGANGVKQSEASRAKRRGRTPWNKGRKMSPEAVEKMRTAALGRKPTAEAIAKTAAANRGRVHSAETRAKIAAKAIGRTHTEETKAIIRAKRRVQTNVGHSAFTVEQRAKMSAAKIGKKQSVETCAKRSASLKRAYAEGRRLPRPAPWLAELSRSRKGVPRSLESRDKQSATLRRKAGY